MSTDSDAWVERTSAIFKRLRADALEPQADGRLTTFLDLATTARLAEVGFDQTITDLNRVLKTTSQ
jgi:hypothetical protein